MKKNFFNLIRIEQILINRNSFVYKKEIITLNFQNFKLILKNKLLIFFLTWGKKVEFYNCVKKAENLKL